MGLRGPPPKPSSERELEGNRGKRGGPIAEDPEVELLTRAPQAPPHLSDIAQQAWRVLASELVRRQLLARQDLFVLEQFCETYAVWRDCLRDMRSNGIQQDKLDVDGDVAWSATTPATQTYFRCIEKLNTLSRVLGIGPAYRACLRGLHGKANGDDDSDDAGDDLK